MKKTDSKALIFRPFSLADLDLLNLWLNSDEAFGEFDGPGDGTRRDDIEYRLDSDQYSGCQIVSFETVDFAWTSTAIDRRFPWIATLTVILARPEFRGRGFGTKIHQELIAQIQTTPEIKKIEVWTDTKNLAEQRVLEKCGFQVEGIFARKWRLRGQFRDMMAYALLPESSG